VADARIASLYLYPVKGARSVPLEAATAATTGLTAAGVADREWMVVDPDGRFVTQREIPTLALVAPAIDDGVLTLEAPTQAPVSIALDHAPAGARDVTVWRSHVRGFDEGDDVAAWLSAHLARPVRLVRFDRTKARKCNPDYVGKSGAHTLFADGYPMLIIGAASLADLNERLVAKGEAALPMNRFRPNIVVEGLDAYDEDHVDTLTLGALVLRMVKPCTRCQVTTTDQATAAVGHEPLTTLSAYRYNERLSGIAFGMNAIVAAGSGSTIAVDDVARAELRF
jgi:uncharacterized protein YcbX